MASVERLVERLEETRFGRLLQARLGEFSPLATLRTFSPGSRALLESTERAAELGLHLARGFILVVATVLGLVFLDVASVVPPALLVLPLLAIAALWFGIWRVLKQPRPPRWLTYALIAADVGFVTQDVVIVRSPLYDDLGLARLYTPADVAAVTGALLVAVSLSGAFRLIPQAAAFSMLASLVGYWYVATALAVPRSQAIVVAGVIWLAGVLGAHACRLFRQMALRAAEQAVLERYVPRALTRELALRGDLEHAGREVDITVLIIDIRGYTRRTEKLAPAEVVRFLNDYFGTVVAPLAARGAVLDKYIGDGVFAFFEGDGHAERAMASTHEILAAVDCFNQAHPEQQPVKIGIALHSGPALVGTIGSEHKREYTAVSDAVNVTARLEELNKRFGSRVVASEVLIAAVGAQASGFVGPELTDIRGREAPLRVHYLA